MSASTPFSSANAPSSASDPRSRAVLVTGAAKRVGRGIAIEFARQGWEVAVHYGGSAHEAHEVVAEIEALGRRAVALKADLGDEAEVACLVPACVEYFGGLNCVVNCASQFDEDTATDFTYAKLLAMTAVNVAAPVLLARMLHDITPADAAHVDAKRGVVINVLDQKLYNMNPDYLSYTLTKAALDNATVALAQALGPKLRVAGLAPGLTLISPGQTPETFEAAHRVTPLNRASRVEDIAQAACYLANAYGVTGTTLVVDGGQHLVPSPRDVMYMFGANKNDAP
ncbi:FolM Alternative dihydrofolate reductase 1 [Candidatus Burkholderia verschuerenii]|uniref:FolM Alternative dihydrofolate reductase 1 n=1 Tax=Candidatus Burkholderia verschuerenii TaxID=242163 RepID=A0A0L0MF12_9BURK|nr:SDR family oxidoreductase [Candidatus Burkholderia verschuerenii]KND60923.1 FolM Alternative dihydrofolate reductase 1 [Candidatus Burkholderia verschuerenii]